MDNIIDTVYAPIRRIRLVRIKVGEHPTRKLEGKWTISEATVDDLCQDGEYFDDDDAWPEDNENDNDMELFELIMANLDRLEDEEDPDEYNNLEEELDDWGSSYPDEYNNL